MRDIVNFVRLINGKYGTECLYFPDDDIYSIRLKGRAVQNFKPEQFYTIPKRQRMNTIRNIIKIGLEHNIGEKTLQNQIFLDRNIGRKIH